MPRIEFEGIKINLNSLLLMGQLAGLVLFVGVTWGSKDSAMQNNSTAIERLQKDVELNRKELEAQRSQAIATAVLKTDMDNMKMSLARIERTLEGAVGRATNPR